jgi:DNA-binding NarL/FixJ family response regulator
MTELTFPTDVGRLKGPNIQRSSDQLTDREQEVLLFLAEGYTTKEIAVNLGISFKTAACHRSHILSKAGARNTVALTRYAIRQNWIKP